ncbi:MAG: hypothetical protein AAGJ31_14345 [Verrucomicrobiota bacterium]
MRILILAFLFSFAALSSRVLAQEPGGDPPVWLLQSGVEYYGEVEGYSFQTKEVTLRKMDGNPFAFPAEDLSFRGKVKLLRHPAFLAAIPGYRPPVMPVILLLSCVIIAAFLPNLMGLWGGSQVLGAQAGVLQHFGGATKVTLIWLVCASCWLIGAIVIDFQVPVIPSNEMDLVLLAGSALLFLFAGGYVIHSHYPWSWLRSTMVTIVAGLFSGIIWCAGMLGMVYFSTRNDLEVFLNRTFFEPFQLF